MQIVMLSVVVGLLLVGASGAPQDPPSVSSASAARALRGKSLFEISKRGQISLSGLMVQISSNSKQQEEQQQHQEEEAMEALEKPYSFWLSRELLAAEQQGTKLDEPTPPEPKTESEPTPPVPKSEDLPTPPVPKSEPESEPVASMDPKAASSLFWLSAAVVSRAPGRSAAPAPGLRVRATASKDSQLATIQIQAAKAAEALSEKSRALEDHLRKLGAFKAVDELGTQAKEAKAKVASASQDALATDPAALTPAAGVTAGAIAASLSGAGAGSPAPAFVPAVAAETCGRLPAFPNATTKNYKDSRETKYDTVQKKTVDVTFKPGDKVPFKCAKGFSTNGAKNGETEFEVVCLDHGYYQPTAACLENTGHSCGALPAFPHAHATGKKVGEKFEYSCDTSYTLDGEKPVAGTKKNALFAISCEEFSSTWSKFKGTCQPYAFVPASQIIMIYDSIFNTLFQLSCTGTLKNEFAKLKGVPGGLDHVCKDLTGDCAGLVTKVKADFEGKMKERIEYDKHKAPKWYETNDEAPNADVPSGEFCDKVWELLKLPQPTSM